MLWGVIKFFGGIGSLRSYAQTDDHLSKADLHPLLARSAQQWESKGGRGGHFTFVEAVQE